MKNLEHCNIKFLFFRNCLDASSKNIPFLIPYFFRGPHRANSPRDVAHHISHSIKQTNEERQAREKKQQQTAAKTKKKLLMNNEEKYTRKIAGYMNGETMSQTPCFPSRHCMQWRNPQCTSKR